MTSARTAAHDAYRLATAQLGRLRDGDVDAYLSHEAELDAVYRSLLDAPGDAFDDETRATTRELTALQQAVCAELEALMDGAADALAAQRRRRQVTGAYGLPGEHGPVRSA